MELVQQAFPDIDGKQLEKLDQFMTVFRTWNERINLVSRKDIDSLELHHLLHSLAIMKWATFVHGQRILDVGTGGGFPGIPLAIVNPHIKFFLCDSVEKKTKALQSMVDELNLKNVQIVHKRAEKLESLWNYVLGRAVTPIPRFLSWVHDNIRPCGEEAFPHGVLYWKGSLYQDELESIQLKAHRVYSLEEELKNEYFAGKFVVHLLRKDIDRVKLPELV